MMNDAIPWGHIKCDCPLVGTFEPTLGDLGIDPEGYHWIWDGKQWLNENGKPAKTFEQWMGFK